jgi:hypothetical protein
MELEAHTPGRPRSHSEGAAFQNSYDYTMPYAEYGGKNGADLALELLGAREAPFDATGHLRVPAWVGEALAFPPVPALLSSLVKKSYASGYRRSIIMNGTEDESKLEGVEEVVALGAHLDASELSDYEDDLLDKFDLVPRLIHELVEDKVVPHEFAALPPEEIAKMFQIKPHNTPRAKAEEHSITYSTNPEGRTIIQHATLAQVVKVFSTDAQDNNSIQRLILAHEHFFDSRSMFVQFTEFFSSHQSASAPDQIIQARVLNVLKRWVEVSWSRMKELGLEPMMMSFIGGLGNNKFKTILDKAIHQSEMQLQSSKLEDGSVGSVGPGGAVPSGAPAVIKPKRSKPKKGESWSLTDFDALEIARQLTLIDMELAQRVNVQEMLKAQWVDEGAPSLFAASKRVNDLTYWLAHQIVSTKELKKRVKVITQIIKIAKHLLALNSFNSFMAVYLAFNLASTARLTKTWTNVPARHFQVWKKMSRLMSPMQNFGTYREHIQTIQPPMILCQEVFLKDLLYEEEGRPDFVEDQVIDMTKMDSIGRLIDQFRQCCAKPYALSPSPVLWQFLKDIPSWDSPEDAATQLDSLSRLVEPSSINFPAGMGNDPASRVKSLGTLPTWKRDASSSSDASSERQLTNPKSPRASSPTSDELPLSPRSAVIASSRPKIQVNGSSTGGAGSGAGDALPSPTSSTSPASPISAIRVRKTNYRTTSPKAISRATASFETSETTQESSSSESDS